MLLGDEPHGVPRIVEQTMGINYGFDKVRFMTPVKSARVRAARRPRPFPRRRHGDDPLRCHRRDRERAEAGATADWITIIQFDPKDRPENVNVLPASAQTCRRSPPAISPSSSRGGRAALEGDWLAHARPVEPYPKSYGFDAE